MRKGAILFLFLLFYATLVAFSYFQDSGASDIFTNFSVNDEMMNFEIPSNQGFPASSGTLQNNAIRGNKPVMPQTSGNSMAISDGKIYKADGIVANIWLQDNARLDRLRKAGIKYLFVDVGGTEKNGFLSNSEKDIVKFLDFIKKYESANNYDFVLLAYSEVYLPDYSFDQAFISNYISSYKRLVKLGFDGLHVDIESISRERRADYLSLLKQLRFSLPMDSMITVYAGPLGSNTINPWEWDSSFYKEVSPKVDIVVVPAYDLSYQDSEEYKSYVRSVLARLSEEGYSGYFMLGVPTHKKYPETLSNALAAYKKELPLHRTDRFLGVAVFSEWTISNEDWDVLNEFVI